MGRTRDQEVVNAFYWSTMKNYIDAQKKGMGGNQVGIANINGLAIRDSLEEQKKAGSNWVSKF